MPARQFVLEAEDTSFLSTITPSETGRKEHKRELEDTPSAAGGRWRGAQEESGGHSFGGRTRGVQISFW